MYSTSLTEVQKVTEWKLQTEDALKISLNVEIESLVLFIMKQFDYVKEPT